MRANFFTGDHCFEGLTVLYRDASGNIVFAAFIPPGDLATGGVYNNVFQTTTASQSDGYCRSHNVLGYLGTVTLDFFCS